MLHQLLHSKITFHWYKNGTVAHTANVNTIVFENGELVTFRHFPSNCSFCISCWIQWRVLRRERKVFVGSVVFHEIEIYLFTKAAVSVTIQGENLLLLETQLKVIKQVFSIVSSGICGWTHYCSFLHSRCTCHWKPSRTGAYDSCICN